MWFIIWVLLSLVIGFAVGRLSARVKQKEKRARIKTWKDFEQNNVIWQNGEQDEKSNI